MQRIARFNLALFLSVIGLSIAGCDGSGNDNSTATATATVASATATATSSVVPSATPPPSATPTAEPTATFIPPDSVSGLAVLSSEVITGNEDSVASPPADWLETSGSSSFSRALSFADWTLFGAEGRQGTTAADGTFAISGLAPGHYTLALRKTLNGNLVTVDVPLVVGEDGGADILIEIDRGRVRSATTYRADGRTVRSVSGPDDSHARIEDGRVVEVVDPANTLRDPDGDGRFERTDCLPAPLWRCGDIGEPCDDGRSCQCSASCPFCEDCGPSVCAPSLPYNPYRCGEDGTCSQPGDVCTCVSSCPDCDDCALSVCVPSCNPVTIESLSIVGVSQVAIGRRANLQAVAELDNGQRMDVTYLVDWATSNAAIATVDAWGNVTGLETGSVLIGASFNGIEAAEHTIEVVERPGIRQLEVHVFDCIVPYGIPGEAPTVDPDLVDLYFPYPACREVVRIGATANLAAFATFTDGSFEIVTDRVAWTVEPGSVAKVDRGEFTGLTAGTATVTATLDGVVSEPLEMRVVDRATVVQLSIYPDYGIEPPIFLPAFVDDPAIAAPPLDCFDCGTRLVLLGGDTRSFHATARYDTGDWEDVTSRVEWSTTDSAVAPIDATGVLTATAPGSTTVTAELDGIISNDVFVEVVEEASIESLYIYPEGNDRVVGKGGEAIFRAQGYYDVGFARDVTREVAWQVSDSSVATFTAPGVLTGVSAGEVELWASLDGMTSERLTMAVFETSDIEYCDPSTINRASWSDAFNRVVLESDCAEYIPPDVVELRFTVTERERPVGIFDPCLDLYVYDGDRKVRTIREEGCGEPFLAPGAPEFADEAPRFQLKAFWDLKDDAGRPVAPGLYTVYGRFYLYYDPVVRLQIAVTAPDGQLPCTPNDCGNGCGYVHACGDEGKPSECPDVCTSLCECPAGWGATGDGGCEPCPLECCPPNARCTPDLPPCDPEPTCCRPGEFCTHERPLCETAPCCPEGAFCGPVQLPPCGPPHCCPEGALCGPLDLPVCEQRCCAAGERCEDSGLWACEACCDPGQSVCLQGMPRCTNSDLCCPPGAPCPDLPACDPACCPPDGGACPEEPIDCPAPDPCMRTGCSGQICASEPVETTCEFRAEYRCYAAARCERQSDGGCGWTPTEELRNCLDDASLVD